MGGSVVHGVPAPVFAESTAAAARMYDLAGMGYDYAIGSLPFNAAASVQRPITRATAQMRKDQSDTSREPGEHSLAFWWLRAQSSFHGGAGQKYLGSADTQDDGLSPYRYLDSEGVDVLSEPGAVTLLPQTSRFYSTGGVPLIATTDSGNLYLADGPGMLRYTLAPAAGQPDLPTSPMTISSATVAWGGVPSILSLTTDGSSYYLATNEGVYAGSGVGAATRIYALPTGSTPLLRYVKQRLILALSQPGVASAVYELNPAAAANTVLPTPVFSGTTTWKWTSIVQSPTAILVAGDNGARSSIYKMTLSTSGSVPILNPGVVTAEFPPGELVTGMNAYLGTVLGIQTTAGFRVALLDASGDFQYGGLLFTHDRGKASSAVVGMDNSFYVGKTSASGAAGLARVDLGHTFGSGQSLKFPWAPDLRSATTNSAPYAYAAGTVSQAMTWNYGRKVFIVPGVGAFVEQHYKVDIGKLSTSRIRWDTLEPKLLRFARFRGEGSGSLQMEISRDSDTSFVTVGSSNLNIRPDSGDIYVQMPPGQFFSLRITLTDDGATGPMFTGYQLKALPAQRRQRMIALPLACYDREVGNSGQIMGGEGSAMDRLLALESLEQSGEVVALQWFSVLPGQQLTEYVMVEQVQFEQTASASDSRGWGGVISLTLRTVD